MGTTARMRRIAVRHTLIHPFAPHKAPGAQMTTLELAAPSLLEIDGVDVKADIIDRVQRMQLPDTKLAVPMIASLAGLDKEDAKLISVQDMWAIWLELLPFFLPADEPETSSNG